MGEVQDPALEFKANDSAWYAGIATFEGCDIRVHFPGFDESEDELWSVHKFNNLEEAKKSIRPASQPMQDEQCDSIREGMLLCVACRRQNSKYFEYYDARVLKVSKCRHTNECTCKFQVSWLGGPLANKTQWVHCGDICFLIEGDIEDDPVVREYLRRINLITTAKRATIMEKSTDTSKTIAKKRKLNDEDGKPGISGINQSSGPQGATKNIAKNGNHGVEERRDSAGNEILRAQSERILILSSLSGNKVHPAEKRSDDSHVDNERISFDSDGINPWVIHCFGQDVTQKHPKNGQSALQDKKYYTGNVENQSYPYNFHGNGSMTDSKECMPINMSTSDQLGKKSPKTECETIPALVSSSGNDASAVERRGSDTHVDNESISFGVYGNEVECERKQEAPQGFKKEKPKLIVSSRGVCQDLKYLQVKREEHIMESNKTVQCGQNTNHVTQMAFPFEGLEQDVKPLPDILKGLTSNSYASESRHGSLEHKILAKKVSESDIVTLEKVNIPKIHISGADKLNVPKRPSLFLEENRPSLQHDSYVQAKTEVEDLAPPPLVGESRNYCGCSSPSSCHVFVDTGVKNTFSHPHEGSSTCSISSICPHHQSRYNCSREVWDHCTSSTSCRCSFKADDSSKEAVSARELCRIAKEVKIWSPSQLLLIENLERDMTSSKALKVVSKMTNGAVMVYIWPKLEYERTRKGYICYQDAQAAENAYMAFTEGKFMIVSRRGRPWVICRPDLDINDWNLLYGVCVSASLKDDEETDLEQEIGLKIVYCGTAEYPSMQGRHKLYLEQRKQLQYYHWRFSKEEEELDSLLL